MNTPISTIWPMLDANNSSLPEDIPMCRGVPSLAQAWTDSPPKDPVANLQENQPIPSGARLPGVSILIGSQNAGTKIWKRLTRLFDPNFSLRNETRPTVAPRVAPTDRDWRAYGYWACPRVNNVNVNNQSSASVSPIGINVDAVFHSLIGPNGSPHPERWIPGLIHPALPPRPSLWDDPSPSTSISECDLNPFLRHRVIGYSPVYFRIDSAPIAVYHRGPLTRNLTVPLWLEELAQPATHPFLTTMHIKGVADDDDSIPFPWPIIVHNPTGVLLRDVFAAITQNFTQYVTHEEFLRWSRERQHAATRAYNDRVAIPTVSIDPFIVPARDNTGMRRVDYMGERILFRGLEPSPENDETWVMFLGPM